MDIFVSGYGVSSSLGHGFQDNWNGISSGISGIRSRPHYSAYSDKIILLGSIEEASETDRLYSIANVAFTECIDQARLSQEHLKSTALIFAQSGADFELISKQAKKIESNGRAKSDTVYKTMNSYIAAKLSATHKIEAPVIPTSSACSGSALSLHIGSALIKSGAVDRCICGGADIISYQMYQSFNSMRFVLSNENRDIKCVKPFGIDRSGIVLGEGAGFILIENAKSINKRNGTKVAELAASSYENVPNATWGDIPDDRIWSNIIEKSISARRRDIDYVVTHGTSTSKGDLVEGKAIQKLFPESFVTSFKYYFGHTLAASTILDTVMLMGCFENQEVVGVGHDYELDSELDGLKLIRSNTELALSDALKLTAGFGGSLSCLYFSTDRI